MAMIVMMMLMLPINEQAPHLSPPKGEGKRIFNNSRVERQARPMDAYLYTCILK
jgi:hypothetical protein